ncbi:rod shape-determining protein RodA [Arenimonas maotaiensis]|uniref:Rod shape-determining protein RodA n=1 Tax=Arenimonas maotaiensis TaxID=1446479 RepID=A0A917FJW3_9GAMM|nr:rod shape-determining protein RodA [Arenimonas maotaiensis]GGF88194.1 rod shape-determining protein RodA [Arenimonas maotaiensis]
MVEAIISLRRFIRRLLARVDAPLMLALMTVMAVSLLVQASAGEDPLRAVLAQGARFVIGSAALVLIANTSPANLRAWTPWVYGFTLALMPLVFLFGSGRSANLWLDLGVFYLQPGELLKLSVPMMLAWYLNRQTLPPSWRTLLVSAVIVGAPVALIVKQPDFGTGMLVLASGGFALFLAGLQWQRIAFAAAAAAAAIPIGYQFLMPYQKDRIHVFLNPESAPQGAGWNIIQSKIAIGSGGLTGKGWGDSTQANLDFLPEHTTDFAFSVFSEEWGWLGVLAILLVYFFIISRALWMAMNARDAYSRLLAGALALTFFIYILVNAGMVAGFLPVVGVPMPLISYGGTSAVSLLAGFGLVMSAYSHRKYLAD